MLQDFIFHCPHVDGHTLYPPSALDLPHICLYLLQHRLVSFSTRLCHFGARFLQFGLEFSSLPPPLLLSSPGTFVPEQFIANFPVLGCSASSSMFPPFSVAVSPWCSTSLAAGTFDANASIAGLLNPSFNSFPSVLNHSHILFSTVFLPPPIPTNLPLPPPLPISLPLPPRQWER